MFATLVQPTERAPSMASARLFVQSAKRAPQLRDAMQSALKCTDGELLVAPATVFAASSCGGSSFGDSHFAQTCGIPLAREIDPPAGFGLSVEDQDYIHRRLNAIRLETRNSWSAGL